MKSVSIGNESRTFSTRARSRDLVSETERIIIDIRSIIKERVIRAGDTLKRKRIRSEST